MCSNKLRMRWAKEGFLAAAICLGLAGCGGLPGMTDESEPVGIGRGTDDFKRSPCACIDVPQRGVDGPYQERLRRRLGAPPGSRAGGLNGSLEIYV